MANSPTGKDYFIFSIKYHFHSQILYCFLILLSQEKISNMIGDSIVAPVVVQVSLCIVSHVIDDLTWESV